MSAQNQTKTKKKLEGIVVSNKAQKTIVVNVVRRHKDRVYSKFIHSSKKYHAHDENCSANEGDRVTIIESRPHSKLKRWELLKIN